MKINMKNVTNTTVVLAIIFIIWYKIPVKIDENYQGYILSYDYENLDSKTNIHVKGKLQRNILSVNDFDGAISIGEYSMKISSSKLGNLKMRYLSFKNKLTNQPIGTLGIEIDDGFLHTVGIARISTDFKKMWGYSQEMRENSTDGNLMFVAPAEKREQAKKIIYEMTSYFHK